MLSDVALAFVAGLLTVLSPCVLPALPLVVGSALNAHRLGPLAVAAGMIVSFTVVGVAVSAAGTFIGLSPNTIRLLAGSLLIAAGAVLVSNRLQRSFARMLTPLSKAADSTLSRYQPVGLWGQFFVGLLLGAVWSPCSGPSLGVAVSLAAQAKLTIATTIMIAFGTGAALPLLAVAYGLRGAFLKSRDKLLTTGNTGKLILGWILVAVGLAIVSGLDKSLEATIVPWLPDWLNDLSTRY